MLNLFLVFTTVFSINLFAQDEVSLLAYSDEEIFAKRNLIFEDVKTPKDISHINRCVNAASCDIDKTNEALNYIAAVAMSTDYTNNMDDKIADLEKNYTSMDEYKDIESEDDRRKIRDVMKKYIEYLKAINISQKLEDARKRLPLLYGKEKQTQLEYIKKYESEHPVNLDQKRQALNDAYEECSPICEGTKATDFFSQVNKEVNAVSYTKKTGNDLYDQIKSQSLEACKKGSKNDPMCKFVSSRQSLAFISGNDPSTQTITKYTDKNCPLATRILQEQNVKPVLNTLCLGQMQRALNNQMEKGTTGIMETLGHVNFVNNICPEMAAQTPFIQKYNLSGSGAGLAGLPASFDLAGGTGAVVPNQNLLTTGAGNWYNPMWNASTNNINTNNMIPGGGGAPTVKLTPASSTDFYNSLSNGYNKAPSQINAMMPQVSSQYNDVQSYNSSLSQNALAYMENKTAYQGYLKAASELDTVAGGSTVNVDDYRLEITRLQAQGSVIWDNYMSVLRDAYAIELKKRFGNIQETAEAYSAGARAGQALTMYSITQQQIYALQSQLVNYQGYSEVFDISNMYAQAGKNINIRKNKIKTPINTGSSAQYSLKPNWRSNLKNLSKQMLSKAETAKRNANIYRSNMQKLLKKNAPILSLEKLPSLDMLAYEIKNMEAWRKAGINNMKMIDKAVSDNKLKRLAYDEKQMNSLRSSMENMLVSIDKTRPSAKKAFDVLNDLYAEAPKTEELRTIAKQMVEQGL